ETVDIFAARREILSKSSTAADQKKELLGNLRHMNFTPLPPVFQQGTVKDFIKSFFSDKSPLAAYYGYWQQVVMLKKPSQNIKELFCGENVACTTNLTIRSGVARIPTDYYEVDLYRV